MFHRGCAPAAPSHLSLCSAKALNCGYRIPHSSPFGKRKCTIFAISRFCRGVAACFWALCANRQHKKAIVFAFLHQRWLHVGAADEARTRYLHLGKVALYQMSYGRISGAFIPAPSRAILANFGAPAKDCEARFCGEKEKIWYSSQKSCLQDFPMNDRIFDVVPPIGIEPMTRGFSVPCSTD